MCMYNHNPGHTFTVPGPVLVCQPQEVMQITISWSPPTDPMHAIESSLHAYEIGSNSNTLSKDQEKIFQY